MPKSYPVPTLVIGSIEDAQLPPGKSLTVIGRRPVSLQIKVEGNTGPVFEWFLVERALRQRICDLARQEQLPMGKWCTFMVDENGAIIGFIVIPNAESSTKSR